MIHIDEIERDGICLGLSGGMDSATLLGLLKNFYNYKRIYCLGFDYGSKHNKYEIECAKALAKHYDVEYTLLDMRFINKLFVSDLLQSGKDIPEGHYNDKTMSKTVVPGRNIIFASILAGYAWSKDCKDIALGVHFGDHCLPHDEFVTTDYGKVPVIDLNIGDRVLSFNENTQQVEFKSVINKVDNGIRSDILNIRTAGNREVSLTSNHKVYYCIRSNYNNYKGCNKKIEKIEAKDLKVGDCIIVPTTDKELLDFDNISKQYPQKIDLLNYCDVIKEITQDEPKSVFDIEVEDNHNFFAGKGSGILVSNSIYSDCRKEFIKALDTCLYLGTDKRVNIISPFVDITKKEILEIGIKLNVPYEITRTCYKDQVKSCGKCGSCVERLEAFNNLGMKDPIEYQE